MQTNQLNIKQKKIQLNVLYKKILFLLAENFIEKGDLQILSWKTIYKALKLTPLRITHKIPRKHLKLLAKLMVYLDFENLNTKETKTFFNLIKDKSIFNALSISISFFKSFLVSLDKAIKLIVSWIKKIIIYNFKFNRAKLCIFNE